MEHALPAAATKRPATRVGVAGLVIGLLALAAAVLSPWAVRALEPRPPVDELAVDLAGRIKDRLAAKAKGQPYVAPAEPRRFGSGDWYIVGVLALGTIAVGVGVVGLAFGHDVRLNAVAVAVGAAAIVFQYALLLAAAVLIILLVGFILMKAGAGP